MKDSRRRHHQRGTTAAAAALGTLAGLVLLAPAATAGPTVATAAPRAGSEVLPDYDARLPVTAAQRATTTLRAAAAATAPALSALRAALGEQVVADVDPMTGTPRQLARLDGALTGPSAGAATDLALGYVRGHADVFRLAEADLAGLRLRRDYVDVAGTHHLSWAQTAGGVELFGNGLQANVARDGRVLSLLGSPVAGLAAPGSTRTLDASGALAKARADLREAPALQSPRDKVTPVLFQLPSGTRAAWETITMSAARPALHVVDAQSGRVLYRQSLVADANAPAAAPHATGTAYQYFPGAARGGVQERIDLTARGWLPSGATNLTGNNSHTYADVNDSNVPEPFEEVSARSGNTWDYPLRPFPLDNAFCGKPYPCSWNPEVAGSWRVNRDQNATQVFAFVNAFHDHLAADPIGFTEAAGNFQTVNRTGNGLGGDAVEAQSDDGANTANGLPDANHVDNANMSTPPDGQAPRMQMYLQHLPGTSYPQGDPFAPTNVGDEADTVYHEYTHGLSNRLVVDARGVSTLTGEQGGSMGEAWSDWYAMDYLVSQGLQTDTAKDGDVVLFQYDGAGVALDRSEPIDCKVGVVSSRCKGTAGAGGGGYTYGDLGKVHGTPEVHADGEIWAQTLWDLRDRLSSAVSESLVTRAMELAPANPSFLDMRNAILQADTAVYGGGQRAAIWQVFAARGMGFFAAAASGDDTAPVEDFSLPPAPGSPRGSLVGHVVDPASGPVDGAVVAFGGHASGFPGDYRAVTAADGSYRIDGVFVGTYAKITATAPGFEGSSATVTVTARTTKHHFEVRRDWAAITGGAQLGAFTGPDYTPFGCGPGAAFDLSQGSGWGSTSDLTGGMPGAKTPKSVVVRLPKAVDVTAFAVDPSNTCGDSPSAATADYRIETSTDGTHFTTAASGTFTPDNLNRLNSIAPTGTSGQGVRAVRFTMLSPQVFDLGDSCPGGFSGCTYMDMSELEVYGS